MIHSREVFPEMQHRMETRAHSVCCRGRESRFLKDRKRSDVSVGRSALARAIPSERNPRENSFSRDLICACVSMPMTTCQPGHRLSCPILLVLAWLVLYGLRDIRNGEARNRGTMRTLVGQNSAGVSPVTRTTLVLFFLKIVSHSEDPPPTYTRNHRH
jgi:hypothetical protein